MWKFQGSSLRILSCSPHLLNKTVGNPLEKTCQRLVCPTRNYSSQDSHSKDEQRRKGLFVGIAGIFGAGLAYFSLKKAGYFGGSASVTDDKHTKNPATKKPVRPPVELPEEANYLIIGAGTAAHSAYRAIRAGDGTAKVLLIGAEDSLPYMRPPLSKELWYSDDKALVKQLQFKQWNGRERSLFYEKEGYYCQPKELPEKEFGGVAVALGLKAVRVDVKNKKVYFEDGRSVGYNKCLIATGGKPRNLPVIENAGSDVLQRTILYRTVEDFKNLDSITQTSRHEQSIVIIGGGFMGSELACALGKRATENKKLTVTQLFPEKGNMGMVLPEYLSKWATEKVKKEGVSVLTEKTVAACKYDRSTNKVVLTLNDGKLISADHIIVAVGLEPNTELASSSGLEIDDRLGGFLVNAELEARSNVWVAGDAACFYDVKLGRRRVEHHDHAVVSGRLVGENMTSPGKPYWHQSMFWSDLGPEVGYEAIGIVDSSLPTVSIFAHATEKDTPKAVVEATGESLRSETEQIANPPNIKLEEAAIPLKMTKSEDFGKGVIFYLRNDIVVGIVMWNVFNRMPVARKIINESTKFEDLSEVAKHFYLYGEPEVEKDNANEKKDETKEDAKANANKKKDETKEDAKANANKKKDETKEDAKANANKKKDETKEDAKANANKKKDETKEDAKANANKKKDETKEDAKANANEKKDETKEDAKANANKKKDETKEDAKANANKKTDETKEDAKANANKKKDETKEDAKANANKKKDETKEDAKANANKKKDETKEDAKAKVENKS